MNKLVLIIISVALVGCGHRRPGPEPPREGGAESRSSLSAGDTVAAPSLRKELLQMAAEDQEIRKELIASGIEHPDGALLTRMTDLDAGHVARLKEIIHEHGWPGASLVGADGSNAAFLIVQHAGHATQEELLPLVETAYRAGDLDGQDYALLLDRVLVGRGEPQLYGTQIRPPHEWQKGQPTPYPIRDEERVDERRATMGMPPLAEYLSLVKRLLLPKDADDK